MLLNQRASARTPPRAEGVATVDVDVEVDEEAHVAGGADGACERERRFGSFAFVQNAQSTKSLVSNHLMCKRIFHRASGGFATEIGHL